MAKLLSGIAVLLVLLVGAQAGGHVQVQSGCPPPPVTQTYGCPPPPVQVSHGCPPPPVQVNYGCPPPPVRVHYACPPPPVKVNYGCPPPPVRVNYGCPPPPVKVNYGCPPPPVKVNYGCPPPPVRVNYGCPPPPVKVNYGCPPPPVQVNYGCPPPPVQVNYGCPPPPVQVNYGCPPPPVKVHHHVPVTTTYKCGTLGLTYSPDLSIFLSLVYSCGHDVISIWENAHSKFTVMAPVNDAFKGYDIPKLMADKKQVRYLVGAHLLWNTWLPDNYDECNGKEYTTLSSTKCTIYHEKKSHGGYKTWAGTSKCTSEFYPKRWTTCMVQIVPIKTVLKY